MADDEDDDNRRTRALVGLAIAIALIVVGLFHVQYFRHEDAVDDCLLAHRTNCDALTRWSDTPELYDSSLASWRLGG